MKNQEVNTRVKSFLSDVPLFSALPEQDVDTLLKFSHLREYKKGEYLYRQNDEADRLSIVRNGWIRLYRGNADGEEGAIQLYARGDILGERSVLPGSLKHFFSAQAIGDSLVVNIPASVMKEVARNNPLIIGKMMQGLIDKMGKLHVENEHMALLSASQRVACLLLRLSAHMTGKGGTFTFPYDKSTAAAHLGMKRETFSRALACLRRHGVSCGGSEVVIDNFVRLSESCCTRCSLNTECRGARCMKVPS